MSVYYISENGVTRPEPMGAGRIAEMVRSGELGSAAMAAAPGSSDWFPAALVAMSVEAAQAAAAKAAAEKARAKPVERRVTRPMRGLSWGLGLLGLLLAAAVWWVLGLIVVAVAIAVDRPRYLCGKCGNGVLRSSRLCQGCGAELAE